MRESRKRVCFNKRRYEQYFLDYSAAKSAATLVRRCSVLVMANLVHRSFPEYAKVAYGIIDRNRAPIKGALENEIRALQKVAESAQRTGQVNIAAAFESAVSIFREGLDEEKSFSTKSLGIWNTKRLPFAPLYLVCLEEYVSSKAGRKPLPSETTHILSAILEGFDRYPELAIDADGLSKRLTRFRKRQENRTFIEEISCLTQCDLSGENELDRILGKPVL